MRKPMPSEKNIRNAQYALERRRYWLAEAERRVSKQSIVAFWRKAVAEQEAEINRLLTAPGKESGRG